MDVPRNGPLAPALALAASGALLVLLALVDKLVGIIHQPLPLVTAGYAAWSGLVAWVFLRGLPLSREKRVVRVSRYAALLLLTVLTAGYVWAWRVSADPTPVVVQRQLAKGDALLAQNDRDGAHLAYLQAYKQFPRSFAVLMSLGAVNYRLGDYDRAQRYYQRALEVAPVESRYRALSNLGQTHWKLQDPSAALDYYEQAEKAGIPASFRVEWHYRVAWASFDVNDYDRAIQNYAVVASAGQKYAAASYWNMACAQAQMIKRSGDPRERERLVAEAVENLRQAWRHSETAEEREFVHSGLLGGPEDRDPELAPLWPTPAYRDFVREFRGG